MTSHHLRYVAVLLFLCQPLVAREYRDTLRTRSGDLIIVPYSVSIAGDQVAISLRPAIKKLSKQSSTRYRRQDELTVVLFDRNGSFLDASFSGERPEAFLVPAEVEYNYSEDGFFTLHDSPTLSFRLLNGASGMKMQLPVFLAHHPMRGKYNLIANCGSISVNVSSPVVKQKPQPESQDTYKTVNSTIEIESDNTDITRVLDCIGNISKRLPQEDRLPFSESLEGDVRLLRAWQYDVKDRRLKEKINETLDAYEVKKKQLQDAADAAQRAAQAKAAQEQKRIEEEQKAKEAEAEAAQKEEAEKSRKRNVWMVIGGIFSAVLAFLGNQVLQNRRNAKSQKSMMEMQQSITRQAENAAKRRAQSLARSKTNQIIGKTRSAAESAVKNGLGNVGKTVGKTVGKAGNKKNFSI